MWYKYITREKAEKLVDLKEKLKFCQEYKIKLADFMQKIELERRADQIDEEQYYSTIHSKLGGKSLEYWMNYYDEFITKCRKKILELEKGPRIPRLNSQLFIALTLIIVLGLSISISNPDITGVAILSETFESSISGYEIEGRTKWAEIKGDRLSERCLKVGSDIEFDRVDITAKITDATDENNLVLGIYDNSRDEEPSFELGNCRVRDYSSIWKSCEIKLDETRKPDDYWICAYVSDGNPEITYYLISHQPGDKSKRALWTGSYWQKLERASYTIKAEFMK